MFEKNIKTARLLGSFFHNTQILTYHDDGHPIADNEVVATYMNFSEIGDKYGVIPCFEVHVNMWSEDFRRVAGVGRAIEARGAKFNMTLDHRHIIFKIDKLEEQEISNIRDDVEMGKLILDPYVEGNVVQQWIDSGWIRHCHARSTVPNNPKNFDTLSEDGKPGRGIQYPF